MAKYSHTDVLDAALNYVKTNATRECVCSAQPTTYAEATSTYALADVDIDSSDFTGPTTGDTSGRKLTVNAQNNVPIDTTGSATHVALVDVNNSKLLYVTTCTTKALTAGDQVNIPAWDIEFADPA